MIVLRLESKMPNNNEQEARKNGIPLGNQDEAESFVVTRDDLKNIFKQMSMSFVTREEAGQIAEDTIPYSLQHLDDSLPAGGTLKMGVHGHAMWGADPVYGGLDTDYCYVGVKKLTIPTKTSDFLKIYLDGITTPEWVAAMPTGDQDVDSIVIDVTKNRIYLNGETAG